MTDQHAASQLPLSSGSLVTGFDVVIRGYDRGQVDHTVAHLEAQLSAIAQRTADLEDALGAAQGELAAAQEELERSTPSYESLGERVKRILVLADEEAQEHLAQAQAQAAQLRAELERDAEESRDRAFRVEAGAGRDAELRLRKAAKDAEESLAAARVEADRVLSEAHTHAEAELQAARDEAEQLRSEAQKEVEQTIFKARHDAQRRDQESRKQAEDLITNARLQANEARDLAAREVAQRQQQRDQLLAQMSSIQARLGDVLSARQEDGPV